jgi:hypothetical protein
MKLDENEQKLGTTWFFVVGPVGLLFILFLAKADLYLTYTDAEDRKNDSMHELRLAQTSLATVTLDERNAGERSFRAPAESKKQTVEDSHGESHASQEASHH